MDQKSNNSLMWVVAAILIVLGVVYFSSKGPASAPKETGPIVIGAVAPLTGDASSYGEMFANVQNLAVEEINAAGGIDGRQIKVVWEDGKCNGTDATTAAQKLLNIDKVRIILGGVCSSETLAMAPLTQAGRDLLFSAGSSSPDITTAGDLVFRDYPSDAFQGKIMADYAVKKLAVKKAAVISENTDYAQGLRKVFSAGIIAGGSEIVGDETFNTGDTDFRTLMTKIKASNPDFIYILPQTPTSGILILKQIKESGLKVQLGIGDAMLGHDDIAKNAALYEGALGVELTVDEKNEKATALMAAYKTKYGSDPAFPGYATAAYDSVYLLADAIKATGGTDPEKIAAYFNDLKDWQGSVGTLNFDENGDALLGLNLRKIQNGKVMDLGAYAL